MRGRFLGAVAIALAGVATEPACSTFSPSEEGAEAGAALAACPRTCPNGTTVFGDRFERVPLDWSIDSSAGGTLAPSPNHLSSPGSLAMSVPENVSSRAIINKRLHVTGGRACFEICLNLEPGNGSFAPDLAVSHVVLFEARSGMRDFGIGIGRAPFVNRGSNAAPVLDELATTVLPFRRWLHVKLELDQNARRFDLTVDDNKVSSGELENEMPGDEVFLNLGPRARGEHPAFTVYYEDPLLIQL